MQVESRMDAGLVREQNEDAFALVDTPRLLIVADGMGGYKAGEVASHLAVETCLQQLQNLPADVDKPQALQQAVEYANQAIHDAAEMSDDLAGMGTTLVLAWLQDDHLWGAYIGDSRLYLYRQGQLQALTSDHTVIQEIIDTGAFPDIESAQRAGVNPNILTRALGVEFEIEVTLFDTRLLPDDQLLLCADGLSSMLSDAEILEILQNADHDVHKAADNLLDSALLKGGTDNITLILATLDDLQPVAPKPGKDV